MSMVGKSLSTTCATRDEFSNCVLYIRLLLPLPVKLVNDGRRLLASSRYRSRLLGPYRRPNLLTGGRAVPFRELGCRLDEERINIHVEDEALIRMMLVEMIEDLGHKVIGAAGRIDEGRSLADTLEYDLAILDINLQGFNVQPIAEAVRRRGRPLFFLSGYGPDGVPIGFEGTPVLNKPCTHDRLKRMIDAVMSNLGR